jgi:hypothetical protein
LDCERRVKSRFQDFRKHEICLCIFASPFEADVEALPERFQMELLNMQRSEEIKSDFMNASCLKVYKLYFPQNNCPKLFKHAFALISLFGSTYI